MPDITRIPPRSSRYYAQITQAQTRPQAHPQAKHGHWLFGFGLGMLIIITCIFIAQFVVIPSYHRLLDRWQYGEYPISHLSADIGHGGKSDIYSFGVQNSVVVLVVTRGKVEAYQVPLSGVRGGAVVLVSVMDINSDDRPDLVVHVDGTDVSTVLYNNGHTFQNRP